MSQCTNCAAREAGAKMRRAAPPTFPKVDLAHKLEMSLLSASQIAPNEGAHVVKRIRKEAESEYLSFWDEQQ